MEYSDYIFHKNAWFWGSTIQIIRNDGSSTIEIQYDNKYPSVAFMKGISVMESARRKGRANEILHLAEQVAKSNGYAFSQLSVEKKKDWLVSWYNRCGYKIFYEDDNEFVMLKVLKA